MEGQAVGITNVGGFGYSYGYGYDGFGDGSGYGYGYDGGGDGSGYGYSHDDGELVVPKSAAWRAYHYIKPDGDAFIMRNGVRTAIGSVAHENSISMCHVGLHASLSETDAKKYAPEGSVCTRVLVWGRVIVAEDKLVATYRQLVGVV